MGSRGPEPTPTETLKLRGSWRAKTRKAAPEMAEPECPSWLGAEAKAEWNRRLSELGGNVDRAALAVYCEAWGDYFELCQAVAKQGRVQSVKGGLLLAKNRAGTLVANMAKQLGLGKVKTPIEGADDRKGRFFAK